jgi:hypothetical protein
MKGRALEERQEGMEKVELEIVCRRDGEKKWGFLVEDGALGKNVRNSSTSISVSSWSSNRG